MSSIGAAAREASQKAVKDLKATNKLAQDVDDVTLFTKLTKKAEEAAQSAL